MSGISLCNRGGRDAGVASPEWACHDREMGQLLLLMIGALVIGAIGFGIAVLISGSDPGLAPVEPEGRAVPLPADRPLAETDLARTRFDTVLRGYRMAQVDAALRRTAYDLGYKLELIGVLEAEVEALRDGRQGDADTLRAAREAALKVISGGGRNPSAEVEPPAAAGSAADSAPAAADSAPGAESASGAESAPGAESAVGAESASGADRAEPDTLSHRPQEMRLS
jgi:DivIVA domain-containing protein